MGAFPVLARLDRVRRNAAVKFLAADMPEANDLALGIMAREALAAASARGVKSGNPDGAALGQAGKGNRRSGRGDGGQCRGQCLSACHQGPAEPGPHLPSRGRQAAWRADEAQGGMP
jgi:hypothetical protein